MVLRALSCVRVSYVEDQRYLLAARTEYVYIYVFESRLGNARHVGLVENAERDTSSVDHGRNVNHPQESFLHQSMEAPV